MKRKAANVFSLIPLSFIISTQDLTREQIELIKNHGEVARSIGVFCEKADEWDIEEGDGRIKCKTWMDNFNLYQFLKNLGFKIRLEEDCNNPTNLY